MSLEAKIETLTAAIGALISALQQAPVAAAPTYAPPVAETVIAPTPPLPAMPAPPSFMAPPVAAAPAIPFTDGKGLVDYAMAAYKALGPEKGQGVQAIITGLGHANINDIRPDQYGVFYQGIEALKNG